MTQYANKLLSYIQSENRSNGKTLFSVQSVFLESGIDFGGMDMIERAVNELVDNNYVIKRKSIGNDFELN